METIRVALAILGLALSASLQGCGGGGNTTTTTVTAPPGPATTTTTTTTAPPYGAEVKVMGYNLYWWCTSGNKENWPEIHKEDCQRYKDEAGLAQEYDNIKKKMPFDLASFSEIWDLDKVMKGTGMDAKFEGHLAPHQHEGVDANDVGLAWNTDTFEKMDGPKDIVASNDQYGNRYFSHVRLKVKETGETLVFGTTHGGLNSCDGPEGDAVVDKIVKAVQDMRKPEDSVILMGDYNCRADQGQMVDFNKHYTVFHDSTMTYDNIMWSNWVKKVETEAHNAPPSDHSMVTATLQLPKWPAGQDVPPDPPSSGAGEDAPKTKDMTV